MPKPMLATDKVAPSDLRFPVVLQPKLDGIRAMVQDGKLLSRTLKPIPNEEIRRTLEQPEFEGLDGEIIVGDPTAPGCMQRTTSFVMAPNKTGEPWTYWVFDKWDVDGGYWDRMNAAHKAIRFYTWENGRAPIDCVVGTQIKSDEALMLYEQETVDQGHEGVIARNPDAPYKFGRAGKTNQELVKIKRFVDSEAEIIGVEEEMHNTNEKVTNALGRGERSTAKAGLVGKGTLGALLVRDLYTGVEFKIGTGFNAAQRALFWDLNKRDEMVGLTVKYKSFPVGVKDKPRFPVFLGFRDMEIDG